MGVYAEALPKVKVKSKHCSSSSVEPVFPSKVCPWKSHIAPSVLSHLRVPQVLGNVFQQYLLQTHPGHRGEADIPVALLLSLSVLLEAAAAHRATFLLKYCAKCPNGHCQMSQNGVYVHVQRKRSRAFGSLTEQDLHNLRKN